jgi:hypothetical protein
MGPRSQVMSTSAANAAYPHQPLYGLMHEARTGKRVRFTELEDIAAHHLKDVRAVQPRGPYVADFQFGGDSGHRFRSMEGKAMKTAVWSVGIVRLHYGVSQSLVNQRHIRPPTSNSTFSLP